MSALARESQDGGGSTIPVIGQGTVQRITVETGAGYAKVAIGSAPNTGSAYFTISAGLPEYFRVVPGVSKVEANVGATTNETANAVSVYTTVVRLLYNSTVGEVEVMEGLQ